MPSFFFYKQQEERDCGPTCLRMIAKHYGRNFPIQKLRELCQVHRGGVSLLNLSQASEKLGFRSMGVKMNMEQLSDAQLPAILLWRQNHYVILFKIKNGSYFVADPAKSIVKYSFDDLKLNWYSNKELHDGISLLLSPTPRFYELAEEEQAKVKWSTILRYFYSYKLLFIQLSFGLLIGTVLSLVAPFLTQSMVDIGVNTKNINFVYLILIAQLMFFLSTTAVEFIRSWIMLHITTRINIALLTDFLIKLMNLPMKFFATKTTGDIMQRMSDQGTIQTFLTGNTLGTLFSMLNLLIFTILLAYYSPIIFVIAITGTLLYTGWILLFMKYRRELNYKNFDLASSNQTTVVELITGMQDIKLNNCETQKRWQWEYIQARMFKFGIRNLSLSQYQQAGSTFINQAQNILITFISVKSVIDGQITLGGMMAIQYIVGQVTAPIGHILGLIQAYQDAKISLERLNEIHELKDEESAEQSFFHELPLNKTIEFKELNFRYPGSGNELVLKNISLSIPEGKTTAIVGMSGSGKTTILNLLLRVFEPESGNIYVGKTKLNQIAFKIWRSQCGTVMQEGFIFSDTIAGNIAVGEDYPDKERLSDAIRIANIQSFIDDLPLGLNTMIGPTGVGISQGQRQRLLIARAIYKNPHYFFFDEATSSLDANNENIIIQNLIRHFSGKTVIIIAHRLSTVKNADNIIVLNKGEIIEQGTHKELISVQGEYLGLVKNQLELGN